MPRCLISCLGPICWLRPHLGCSPLPCGSNKNSNRRNCRRSRKRSNGSRARTRAKTLVIRHCRILSRSVSQAHFEPRSRPRLQSMDWGNAGSSRSSSRRRRKNIRFFFEPLFFVLLFTSCPDWGVLAAAAALLVHCGHFRAHLLCPCHWCHSHCCCCWMRSCCSCCFRVFRESSRQRQQSIHYSSIVAVGVVQGRQRLQRNSVSSDSPRCM